MQKMLACLVLLIAADGPVLAANDGAVALGGGDRYQHCADMAKHAPDNAYNSALAWHSSGGGAAADHCAALALVQLGRYSEAAPKLDTLGQSAALQANVRAQLLDQAGNIWLLAEQPQKAEFSFSDALQIAPQDVDILADRARARAMARDWSGAVADLSAALARDADRADLLVLRASARHAAGDKKQARADIDRALNIYPGYGDALVERGAMKLEDGNLKAARADWQSVVSAAPKSRAASLASQYLSQTE